MGYFSENYKTDSGESQESKFLRSSDFEKGLKLKFIGMEAIPVKNNPKDYGANEADWLFKEGLLKEGETFSYTFMADEGEKQFDSKSAPFFISMKNSDPALGDELFIKKTGEKRDTRWFVERK